MLYVLRMMTFSYLKIFTVFSSFSLIIGDDSQNRTTSVDIDHSVVDGEQYIKRIAHGEKVSEKPGLLMFTAPYKLCDGGCKGSQGGIIALGFPLYVGQRGFDAYKKIYHRDYKQLHKNNARAPFKRSTTRATTTTPTTTPTTTTTATTTTTTATTTTVPPTCKIVTIIQYITVTTEPPPTYTTVPTTICPYVPFGMCLKKIKQKHNFTTIKLPVGTTRIASDIIATENKSRDQEKQDNLDRLLSSVTKVKPTNKKSITESVTQITFKDENGELDSNYVYSSELNNSFDNFDKTTLDQAVNTIDHNKIFKPLSDKSKNLSELKDSMEHNKPIIPRMSIMKNPYINPNHSLFIGMKKIFTKTFTTRVTTKRPTIAVTSKKNNVLDLYNNIINEVSILRFGHPVKANHKELWRQITVIDNYLPINDDTASN